MSRNNDKNPLIRNLQSYFSNVLTSDKNNNPQSKEQMLSNDFGIVADETIQPKNRRS